MSTLGEYHRSLPPVMKVYGVLCLMTTASYYLNLFADVNRLCSRSYTHGDIDSEVWRHIKNFFFLGPFSAYFGSRLVMLARYGVLLEKGTFKQRTADFLWMMIFGALSLLVFDFLQLVFDLIPTIYSSWRRKNSNAKYHYHANYPYHANYHYHSLEPKYEYPPIGPSLVFLNLYVWSREVPDTRISIFGVGTIKGIYLPWAMLAVDLIFGYPLKPDIMGILAGHLYYLLAGLHPLSGGKNILKTPLWVHNFVAYWREGEPK